MASKVIIFLNLLGVALAVFPHQDEQLRRRYRRYAPPRNDHRLLQDTLQPMHYDLRIRPDIYQESDKDFNFDGNVTIHFGCRRSTNRIRLHSTELKFNQNNIKVTGQGRFKVTSMDEDLERGFVTFHLDRRLRKRQSYVISLQFSGELRPTLKGLYLTGYTRNDTVHYMAITHMEPHFARRMFPCFDEPALKATFNITVLRKSSHVSLSNMPLIKSELLESGWYADSFDKTPVMPTYLVSIAVTDYKFREGRTKQGIKVRVWWREDQLDNTKLALDTAIKATEWFTEYTGINYTLPKMDHIAALDFSAGAMENWGLIVYSVYGLIFDETKDDYKSWDGVTKIIIHEVAHQWFGNLVTAKWWNEIWINEAITSYMARRCKAVILPETDDIGDHITTRRHAFQMDGYHTAHPIDYSVVRQSELERVFDTITYGKGSLILEMLQGVIGEKEFRHGIQLFLKEHQFSNADQYDLYDAFNEALHYSDQKHLQRVDVGEFMATWIQQAGYPILTILHDENGLSLNQSRSLIDPNAEIPDKFQSHFGWLWIIPLFISTNATGQAVQTPPVFMHDEEVQISNELDFTNKVDATWILGNHGMKGYYIVNYDERNWLLLADQLIKDHTVIPEINRAEMIEDTSVLVRSGKLHLTRSLEFMQYLKNEKDYYPWRTFFSNAHVLGDKLRFTANYGILRSYMLDLISHMYSDNSWRPKEGITHPKTKLNTMLLEKACEYDYKPCLEKAMEIFKDAAAQSIPLQTRRTVFCSAVKSGTVDVWDKVYEMYLEQYKKNGQYYDSLLNDIGYGLSCSKDEWVLRRYLERELERANNVFPAFANVAKNPSGGRVALKLVLERWNDTQGYYVIDSVCENLAQQEDMDMLLDFLKANPEAKTGNFKFFIESAQENIQSNIDWIKNDGKKVVEWLHEIYKE